MIAILSKFSVLCLSSYFVVYFLELKLIMFYNRVVHYYTRIFLILLPHPVPVRVPSMDQIELFNHLLYWKPFNYVQIELLILDSNTWNHLTVCKQTSTGLFRK